MSSMKRKLQFVLGYTSKFPVYSNSGKEYEVTVYIDDNVYVLSTYKKRKILWDKKVCGGTFNGRYDAKEWGYDVVEMAKHQVNKYESKIKERKTHEQSMIEGLMKFDEWDGK